MITQCSLSIDREFGLLVGNRLLFTSLSLAGPCKHQRSFFARPYQQYVRCRIQVSVCEPLGSVLQRPAQFQQQNLEYDLHPSLFMFSLISPKQRLQVFQVLNSSTSVTSNFFCNTFFIPTPRDGAQSFIWSFLDQFDREKQSTMSSSKIVNNYDFKFRKETVNIRRPIEYNSFRSCHTSQQLNDRERPTIVTCRTRYTLTCFNSLTPK